MTGLLTSVLVVFVIAVTDVWVYLDAKRAAAAGSPVIVRIGGLIIGSPPAWLFGCVVLWIFVFPIYVLNRPSS